MAKFIEGYYDSHFLKITSVLISALSERDGFPADPDDIFLTAGYVETCCTSLNVPV